jgi:DNA adenine methylase
MNKPFLKWAGNKYRVLPHLLPIIGTPKKYCEPFGGSMSTALNVNADEYILNDINKDLINLYGLLIDPEEDFISYCEQVFIPDNNIREQ